VNARSWLFAALAFALVGCDKPNAEASSASAGLEPVLVTPCGDKGLPDCPTQAWMKSTLQPFVLSNDGARLAEAFEHLAAAAPDGYTEWASISRSAAKAASSGDLTAAKQSCGDCHSRYRARFRGERRQQKLL
jgi:hypothetical protein